MVGTARYKTDIQLDTYDVPMLLVEYKSGPSRTIVGAVTRKPLGYWFKGAIGLIPVQDYKRIRILFNLIHDPEILKEFGLISNDPATLAPQELEVPTVDETQTDASVNDETPTQEEETQVEEEVVLIQEDAIRVETSAKKPKKKPANG